MCVFFAKGPAVKRLSTIFACAFALTACASAAWPEPATRSPPDFGKLVPVTPQPVTGIPAFRLLALQEALKAGLPFALVDAVIKIESDYRPERVGDVGEIGLMQVRPGTAAMLGFRGTPQDLADPVVNIHYGTTYLGQAWHLTKGDVCRTLMKYRAGHGEETMSPLSASYCARARTHLVEVGSPLAAQITPIDLATTPDLGAPSVKAPIERVDSTKTGKSFWVAFQARIRRIDARIETKWRREAAR